jgi:hypothetical protein
VTAATLPYRKTISSRIEFVSVLCLEGEEIHHNKRNMNDRSAWEEAQARPMWKLFILLMALSISIMSVLLKNWSSKD